MFVDEIRAAVMAAPRVKLPEVAAVLWRAYGAGHVTEAEAEALSALVEERKVLLDITAEERATADRTRASKAAARRGSAPRTPGSLERRRRWAASGRLPPALAARFTPGEVAVLSVVAAEVARHGACTLTHGHLAAVAGVSVSTVKRAFRAARDLGVVAVEVRKATAWRHHPNRVTIVSREWMSWLRLGPRGGGGQAGATTHIQESIYPRQRPAGPSRGLPKGRAAAQTAPESRSAEGR